MMSFIWHILECNECTLTHYQEVTCDFSDSCSIISREDGILLQSCHRTDRAQRRQEPDSHPRSPVQQEPEGPGQDAR